MKGRPPADFGVSLGISLIPILPTGSVLEPKKVHAKI